MKHLSFAKNLIILLIGIVAFILFIAECETIAQTAFVKLAGCALIGADMLLYRELLGEEES